MIVLLSGQIKNIGDFLITERASQLFEAFVDESIVILDRTKDLTPHLDLINNSRFLVLCGGPAYASDIYKGIYPLVEDLSKIQVPIIPFGLGWSGSPAGSPESFEFDEVSREFLKNVHSSIDASSCRDKITESILLSAGFENVQMTGCPVWYDLGFIDQEFVPRPLEKVVITTPASPRLLWQTLRLVRTVKKELPGATFYLSFHRGILPDRHTPFLVGAAYVLMCLGSFLIIPSIRIRDISYDLEKMRFYEEMDFHIGYRVHAHLYFLSRRLPSVLINEDGRGMGMMKTLELPMLNKKDPDLFEKIRATIRTYKLGDYSDFHRVKDIFDQKFAVMKGFLENLKIKY
jgi:hypothetical protein